MKNAKLYLVCVIVSVLYGCADSSSSSPSGSSFDLVCSAFDMLDSNANYESMSNLERNEFITKQIHKLTPNSNAAMAWDAVSSAQSDQRYEIFKIAAEEVTGQEWHCDSMKHLASITGYQLYSIQSWRLEELNALSPTAKAEALIRGFRLPVVSVEMQKIIFGEGGSLAAKEFYPHLQR